ncbi:unnamed protein product [Absidia cylindrospora]
MFAVLPGICNIEQNNMTNEQQSPHQQKHERKVDSTSSVQLRSSCQAKLSKLGTTTKSKITGPSKSGNSSPPTPPQKQQEQVTDNITTAPISPSKGNGNANVNGLKPQSKPSFASVANV